LGFAVASQLAARTWPLCRFVFLRSKVCYALLSALALRFATVAVIGSGWLLSSNKILPMLGTLAHALVRAASKLISTPSRSRGDIGGFLTGKTLDQRRTLIEDALRK
jgi:hypothetical protein